MVDDRDTRVETLRSGDRFRRFGEWLDIKKTTFALTSQGRKIAFICDDDEGRERTVLYPQGIFVAAECMPR